MGTRRRVAVGAAAAGALVAAALVVPGMLADRLERAGAACRDELRATGLGDPRACPVEVAFRGLRAADRDHAREVERVARAETALVAARITAVRDLDATARDRALLDAARAGSDVLELARGLGAQRALVELASDPALARRDPRRAARYGMRAALVLGDRDALVRIARWALADPSARDLDIERDDLACLAGLACPARIDHEVAAVAAALDRDAPAALAAALADPDAQPARARSWWELAANRQAVEPAGDLRIADRLAARLPAPAPDMHPDDDPAATALLHGAWAHAVIAAQLHALAGDTDPAKRALWRSEELAGDLRFGAVDDLATAAVRGLVSPPADALQWLVENHDRSREPRVRAALRHMQALLLVEAGRVTEALVALGRCRHDDTCEAERWTRIAAGMLARQPIQPREIPWPVGPPADSWCAELLRAPDTIPSLIVAPRAEQARARWGCAGDLDVERGQVALPEWLYVAGWLAGDRDPEPWLDTLAPHVPVRRWQRARELAARWRGDLTAADEWKRRRAATEAIVASHPALAVHLGI